MKKIIALISSTVGSFLGWWLGDRFGFVTACYLSILGMGLGLYLGRRLWQAYDNYFE
jgi:predicted membrane chloride channel (bestrophin family)